MKKYLIMALLALVSFTFYSCGDDNDDNGGNPGGGTVTNLDGTYEMATGMDSYQLVIKGNNFTLVTMYAKTEGTYTLNNGKVVLTAQKAYEAELDENYRPIPNKWKEVVPKDGESANEEMTIIQLYDNNVLILEFEEDNAAAAAAHEDFLLLYKKGGTIKATDKDIQGKWLWYMHGNEKIVRTQLEISNGNFDLIIPVWRERYQGTCTYVNGMLTFNVTKFTVRDLHDESADKVYDEWRPLTEEEKSWREPTFGLKFTNPFMANGNGAYCYLANLPAYFVKK